MSVANRSSLSAIEVSELGQLLDLVAPARQIAIHDIRGDGREEDQERDDLGPVPLDEGEEREDRREADARQRQDVGEGPAHKTAPSSASSRPACSPSST